jgi:hypothetical protein
MADSIAGLPSPALHAAVVRAHHVSTILPVDRRQRVAKALDPDTPPALLARADEVIATQAGAHNVVRRGHRWDEVPLSRGRASFTSIAHRRPVPLGCIEGNYNACLQCRDSVYRLQRERKFIAVRPHSGLHSDIEVADCGRVP